jgi:hypothetical protein
MRRWLTALAASLLLATPLVLAQAPAARRATAEDESDKLPVRRVVLYKNGVGYFEHLGRVRGAQTVAITFTSAQLDDVLKSLTTLDLGGGRITSVSYNSEAPLEQRLGALRLPLDEDTTLAQFYGALRGARLEVQIGGVTVNGRLLSVEKRTRGTGDQTTERDELSIVTDSGEVRTIDLTPSTSVRIAERDMADQVGRYLGLLASTRAQDARRMVISTSGSGERQLFVSYISEVPIWKTTYRLVLPTKPDGKPLLQGWAIVDNTVGEDWENVELSLVAGAPQSFIQRLSQPHYGRRPVVPLPESAQLTPQTHEGTMVSGVPGGVVGGVVGGVAEEAVVARAPMKRAMAPPPAPAEARMDAGVLEERMAEVQAAAEARSLGDLFEYKLKEPVTIRKNQSAMVPIANIEIAAERVSLWKASSGIAQPLRALWLTNTSALTLDGGSFTVLDAETFAGEGLVEPLKPGEKRLLSYAVDLGVRVDAERDSERQRVTRVVVLRGVMIQHREERERRTYTIRNEDTTPRAVVIEHPLRPQWKLASGGPAPAETSADAYRFRVTVDSKKTETLVINEARPIETEYALSRLTDEQLTVFVRERSVNPQIEQALRPILAKKAEVAAIAADINARNAEIGRIGNDQQRIRENMKALKGSAEEKELLQRYTRQLNEQENRLELAQKELTQLEQKRGAAQGELNKLIDALALDVAVVG